MREHIATYDGNTPVAQVSTIKVHLHRLLTSSIMWRLLVVAYAAVIVALLAPVLFSSVGGDDSYWVLEKGPETGGSLWRAFSVPLREAFQFDGQPRTTALAFSERRILALLTMKTSTFFSIPPMLVWAAVKLSLVAITIAATVTFVRQLTYRDGSGRIRRVQSASIAFITIAFPLVFAIGSKSQNFANLNGWNFYPTLSYGPFAFFLLFASLTLVLSRKLQGNYRLWALPAIALMVLMGVVVNLSYEILALSIPINVLLLLIQPDPSEGNLWMRWRARFTVIASLSVTYTALFIWIRLQISQMACHATETCYGGTVIDANPRTVLNNFLGALPGNNSDFVREQALRAGRDYPSAGPMSLLLGVLSAVLMIVLWIAWSARNSAVASSHSTENEAEGTSEVRGLLMTMAVGLLIAGGTAVITGINAIAVEQLTTPILSYRSNVITWSGLALAAVTGVRLLMLWRWRVVSWIAVVALLAVTAGAVAIYYPRNVLSAQENRINPAVSFTDSLQLELAQGNASRAADTRRCELLERRIAKQKEITPRFLRIVDGAYAGFEFYHHEDFCSSGVGRDLEPG